MATSQIVIRLQEGLNESHVVFSLVDTLPKSGRFVRLLCDPSDSPFSDVREGNLLPQKVRDAGQRLFANLKQHPVIASKFAGHAPNPENVAAIYLYLQAPRAEALPWEALFDDTLGEFCCLNHRPVGRIVDSRVADASAERPLVEPLRLAAVISAAGIDPHREWHELKAAVAGAGFAIEADVFVALDDLKQEIEADANPAIRAHFIDTREQLLADLARIAPQVLHFFCHGSAEYGAFLDIASRADTIAGGTDSTIKLEARDFGPADVRKALWIVTLNACEGAAIAEEETTLAGSLVDVGVPVVVAMRERVDVAVANLFTNRFYGAFFEEVRRVLSLPLPADGSPIRQTLEWASVLSPSRDRLLGLHNAGMPPSTVARQAKEWTLPALYLRSASPLVLTRTTATAGFTDEQMRWWGELQTLRDYRRMPPLGTPAGVLAQVDDRIAELEQLLKGRGQ